MSKRRQSLFRLATGSMKAHAWINAKLCLVFVCMAVLVCLFTAFTMSVENRRKEIFEANTSSNYMYGESDETELLARYGLDNYKYYTVQRYNLGKSMKDYVGEEIPTVTTNYVTLRLGTLSYNFDEDKTPEMLWLYKGDPFNDIDVEELNARFPEVGTLYTGAFPRTGTDEVLISEKLLDEYGLAPDDVVGSTLSIWLGEKYELPFTVKVVGVICKEYYQLSGHKSDSWQIAPSVVAAAENSIPAVNVPVDTFHVYAFDKWSTLSVDELYALSEEGNLSYCGINSYQQRLYLDKIRTVVTNIYFVIGSILAGGLLLTVMLMIDKFVAVFSRFGGVLLSCGLEQNNLVKLLLVQILMLFLLSIPVALVGALVGYALIVELVELGTGFSMTVSTPTLMALLAVATAVVLVAALIFFGIAAFRLRKKTCKQLMSGQD